MRIRAVTLLELLIAVILFSLVALGFYSVDLFSRNQILSAEHKAQVQNEVSITLDNITKNVARAIGDINNPAIVITAISGHNALLVWVDYNNNGSRDSGDKQIAFVYNGSPNYELCYYSNFTDSPASYEVIGNKIRPDFGTDTAQPTYISYAAGNNYLTAQVSACWNPSGAPDACGTAKNPQVVMWATVKMPSVSLN